MNESVPNNPEQDPTGWLKELKKGGEEIKAKFIEILTDNRFRFEGQEESYQKFIVDLDNSLEVYKKDLDKVAEEQSAAMGAREFVDKDMIDQAFAEQRDFMDRLHKNVMETLDGQSDRVEKYYTPEHDEMKSILDTLADNGVPEGKIKELHEKLYGIYVERVFFLENIISELKRAHVLETKTNLADRIDGVRKTGELRFEEISARLRTTVEKAHEEHFKRNSDILERARNFWAGLRGELPLN